MEVLKKFATYIQNLDYKQLQKFVLMTLAAITTLAGIMTYMIQQEKNSLILKIGQLNSLADKAVRIIAENKKITDEEFRLKEILDKNKDFTIKAFFEQFCRTLNITPEPSWDTRTEALNEKFTEITLPSSFKGQTTEQLVKLLQELDKNSMVYLKELHIKKETQGTIAFDITLAAKRYNSSFE